MNIVFSHEPHPLPPSTYPHDPEDKKLLFIYGLHDRRGPNKVASSRVTDHLFTILKENGLTYYEVPEEDPIKLPADARERAADNGIKAVFVGVSYNVRKTFTPEQYKKLIEGLLKAIE